MSNIIWSNENGLLSIQSRAALIIFTCGITQVDKRVVELALRILRDSAAAGDPFAAEILEERKNL
jgi:hypothetical protein